MVEFVTKETLEEYEAFISSHPKGHFLQSYAWSKQKPEWTWEGMFVRNNDGSIKGAMSVLIRKAPYVPYSIMYAARAPVCDIRDKETLSELTEAAKTLAKKHNAYCLKLDPDISVEDSEFLELMCDLGYRRRDTGKNFSGIQPRFVFRLNLEGHDEESLMAHFHSKTRYNIRLAERKGVQIKLCGKEAVGEFSSMMLETGVRDGFVVRSKEYFENMLDNLGSACRLYMAYSEEGIPIAGTLAILYGDKVWYLYGASSNEHRNLMPNYLLQWSMIKWALENGCKTYDFRGVSGDLSEDNPLYGLYRFKKGFNGDFVEFIGEFDFVFKKFINCTIEKTELIYRKLRKKLFIFKNRK
ncbi:MAG: peptidoglycan bridge formation glycyltransferase FemA/FemB family protein [Oscillospiraceae bacterium]|nr:peptidoglycan bridge formation glycyltransferase FemA/FemB family protein [Oscillospiraceae bacterium]MBQ7119741.1 peptidoglycan bridge formation glycyltransferase FemA/FemB family protein [Oscillospiraceae bacterium]